MLALINSTLNDTLPSLSAFLTGIIMDQHLLLQNMCLDWKDKLITPTIKLKKLNISLLLLCWCNYFMTISGILLDLHQDVREPRILEAEQLRHRAVKWEAWTQMSFHVCAESCPTHGSAGRRVKEKGKFNHSCWPLALVWIWFPFPVQHSSCSVIGTICYQGSSRG